MSDAIFDEKLLDELNDEDLDYDLDPKEENALLQEETDSNGQDDVLDLNEEYEQMDIPDDKSNIKQENLKSKSSPNVINLSEKKLSPSTRSTNRTEKFRRNAKGHKKVFGKNISISPGAKIRRSNTVLINPRFKGPVHVNGRQIAWEKPPPILNEPQNQHQYVQPWITNNVQAQPVTVPQFPVNQYNPGAFVPNNPFMYMQPPVMQPPIMQQPIVQPQVFFNQQPQVQLNQCQNQFRFQPPPQLHQQQPLEAIQQLPETPKLPVHQRLGLPQNNFNRLPDNQINFNTQHNSQYNNRVVVDTNNYNDFSQSSFVQQNQMNDQYENRQGKVIKNDQLRFRRNQPKKFVVNQNRNINSKVVPVARKQYNGQNLSTATTQVPVVTTITEDEDEETRNYRLKIEEQKRKREEILRKKEESRLKNLSEQKKELEIPMQHVNKPVNAPVRNFQPRKPYFHTRQQQIHQPVKTQNYTNNIVITGNDSHQFGQRYTKTIQNKVFNNTVPPSSQPERIVTTGQVSSSCTNLPVGLHISASNVVDTNGVSSFLSNRQVMEVPETNIVVVKNLASTTTVPKIMKLCREIGKVQKIQMEKKEHQATVHFDTVASAHAFYNKFRRCMIDLSMIQVDLVPSEGSS